MTIFAKRYRIIIRRKENVLTLGYKSKDKFEEGEEIVLHYEGNYHLVKIISISFGLLPRVEVEELT